MLWGQVGSEPHQPGSGREPRVKDDVGHLQAGEHDLPGQPGEVPHKSMPRNITQRVIHGIADGRC